MNTFIQAIVDSYLANGFSIKAYTRVSTKAQDIRISHKSQHNVIENYIRKYPDCVEYIKETARGAENYELQIDIQMTKNTIYMFHDVTRFSRSVLRGTESLYSALSNNNVLIFIMEGIVWREYNENIMSMLLKRLEFAENEPAQISARLKSHNAYCRLNNIPHSGRIPYGFKVIVDNGIRKVIEDEDKQKIIKFIRICRSGDADITLFNNLLRIIADKYIDHWTDYHFKVGKKWLKKMEGPMSYCDIALILNENKIPYENYRVGKWNGQKVRLVFTEKSYEKGGIQQIIDSIDTINI